MTELTAEKRAELRRLAEAAKVATDGAFVMSNDDMDTAGQAYEALHGALCWRTVLSMLDALDATESKLVHAWTDCKTLTIARLRAELVAAHAKPSPELTAVEAHLEEAAHLLRRSVEDSLESAHEWPPLAAWLDEDEALGLSAKAGQ